MSDSINPNGRDCLSYNFVNDDGRPVFWVGDFDLEFDREYDDLENDDEDV